MTAAASADFNNPSASTSARQWILLLSFTALLLSLAVIAQVASRYVTAYFDAPREIRAFLDAIDSSVVENESYDLDVAKVQLLEDKLRLGKLLRDIQREGDGLREELNNLLLIGEEDDVKDAARLLRPSARVFWASKRVELQERVRRLDLLRMRFLVVHMGIIASVATAAATAAAKGANGTAVAAAAALQDPEKGGSPWSPLTPGQSGSLARSISDSIKAKPPLRRLTTPATGHREHTESSHRKGWVGVVQELQKSPLLQKRHNTIEMAMARTPSEA